MPQTPKDTSNSARLAVYYITVGALLIVWTGVWSLYLKTHGPVRDSTWMWSLGFFLTGVALLAIGLTVGHIGRAARQADVGEHPISSAPVATPVPPVPVNAQPPVAQVPTRTM